MTYNYPAADYSQPPYPAPFTNNDPYYVAKWSPHADRWIVWDANTNNPPNPSYYTGTTWQGHRGITAEEEYRERYGSRSDLTYSNSDTPYLPPLDTNIETNPAIFVPGELDDDEYYRQYGRPLPPGRTFGASQA